MWVNKKYCQLFPALRNRNSWVTTVLISRHMLVVMEAWNGREERPETYRAAFRIAQMPERQCAGFNNNILYYIIIEYGKYRKNSILDIDFILNTKN